MRDDVNMSPADWNREAYETRGEPEEFCDHCGELLGGYECECGLHCSRFCCEEAECRREDNYED